MKTVIKSVLVASALVAGAANAAIVAPSNGASDLILFVTANNGTANDNFYVFDTGVSLDTAFAKSNVASGDGVDTTKFDTFTGSTKGPMGEQSVEGKVDGDTLTWSAAITSPMPMTLEFVATVSGDTLSGNVKLGAFGNAPLSGVRI